MSDNFETKPQNLIFTKLAFKFVFVEEKFKRSIKNPLSISRVAALTIAGALTAVILMRWGRDILRQEILGEGF